MAHDSWCFGSRVKMPGWFERTQQAAASDTKMLELWHWIWTIGGWRICLCLCLWALLSSEAYLQATAFTEQTFGSRGWLKMALRALTLSPLAGVPWAAAGFALLLLWPYQF